MSHNNEPLTWDSSSKSCTTLAAKALANCELNDGIWSQGSVAGEKLEFCIRNAEMLRSQHMFEKGKGKHLEKDLKVAKQHAMMQWPDMDYVWDTYDCTLESLYTGLEP